MNNHDIKQMPIPSIAFRKKVIHELCRAIAYSSLGSTLLFFFLNYYLLSLFTGLIGLAFLFFSYLNKKGFYKLSRAAIIATSSLGVVQFSFLMGFESGVYLYLFAAPFMIYLLFDFSKIIKVLGVFLIYIAAFVIIYASRNHMFSFKFKMSEDVIDVIYVFNFCSALILCFLLVNFLTKKSNMFIRRLKDQNIELENEVLLRKKSEELLKNSLKERDVLLSEIHHRVKNNMAVISALISLRISKVEHDDTKSALKDTKNQIYSMSLIHNILYNNGSLEKINLTKFFDEFCSNILRSFEPNVRIEIEKNIESVEIDITRAIPIALIFNELITNSIKHAFIGRSDGKLEISVKKTKDNSIEFYLHDNGIGMDEISTKNESTGFLIVQSLIEQLDGHFYYKNEDGSTFTFIIPAER